jgi:hypothetical protein
MKKGLNPVISRVVADVYMKRIKSHNRKFNNILNLHRFDTLISKGDYHGR